MAGVLLRLLGSSLAVLLLVLLSSGVRNRRHHVRFTGAVIQTGRHNRDFFYGGWVLVEYITAKSKKKNGNNFI